MVREAGFEQALCGDVHPWIRYVQAAKPTNAPSAQKASSTRAHFGVDGGRSSAGCCAAESTEIGSPAAPTSMTDVGSGRRAQ